MDSHSWNNKKLQGPLICPCMGFPAPRSLAPPPLFGSDGSRRKTALPNRILVIGKAYDEPICSVHVENLLLQREYIID